MTYEEMAKNINAHVDLYIDAHEVKKEFVAEAIGVSRTAFYQKLRGASSFDAHEAYKLANLIGCTVDELLTTCPKKKP